MSAFEAFKYLGFLVISVIMLLELVFVVLEFRAISKFNYPKLFGYSPAAYHAKRSDINRRIVILISSLAGVSLFFVHNLFFVLSLFTVFIMLRLIEADWDKRSLGSGGNIYEYFSQPQKTYIFVKILRMNIALSVVVVVVVLLCFGIPIGYII